MKKWLIGISGAIVGSLLVAWITGQWDPTQMIPGHEYTDQYDHAEQLARKYNLFATGDESWANPNSPGFQNKYLHRGDIVHDEATGLTWQKAGSEDSMGFSQIDAYLRKLNVEEWRGYSDWRLPSLVEAWTLLEPQKTPEGFHIAPVFDSKQLWVWTSTMTETSERATVGSFSSKRDTLYFKTRGVRTPL